MRKVKARDPMQAPYGWPRARLIAWLANHLGLSYVQVAPLPTWQLASLVVNAGK